MIPDIAFFDSDDVGAYEGPVFDEFVHRWVWSRARRYIARVLWMKTGQGDRADVDEVTNDVHLAVLRRLDRAHVAAGYTPEERFRRFRAFVNTDATHRALTHARRLRRMDELDARSCGHEPVDSRDLRLTMEPHEAAALAGQLWPALEALSRTDLEILYFRVICGYTYREIADCYGGRHSEQILCQRFAKAKARAQALLGKALEQARIRRNES